MQKPNSYLDFIVLNECLANYGFKDREIVKLTNEKSNCFGNPVRM